MTGLPGTKLVVAGPEAFGYGDVAAVLSEVTGRVVAHRQLTYEQMRDRPALVMPVEFAAVLAGMGRAVAEGAEDRTTDTVLRVTGRRPRGFRAHAEQEQEPEGHARRPGHSS